MYTSFLEFYVLETGLSNSFSWWDLQPSSEPRKLRKIYPCNFGVLRDLLLRVTNHKKFSFTCHKTTNGMEPMCDPSRRLPFIKKKKSVLNYNSTAERLEKFIVNSTTAILHNFSF